MNLRIIKVSGRAAAWRILREMAVHRTEGYGRASSTELANLLRQAQEELQQDGTSGLRDLRLICLDDNRVLYTSPRGPLPLEQPLGRMLTNYLSYELGFNVELQFVEEAS